MGSLVKPHEQWLFSFSEASALDVKSLLILVGSTNERFSM